MAIWDDIKRSYQSGNITTRIIYANVAIFLIAKLTTVFIAMGAGDDVATAYIKDWFAIPAYVPHLLQRPWTILSYQFLHLEFRHLIMNVLFLHWFGQFFLAHFTRRQVLSVYLWGGIWGGIFYLLSFNYLPYFQDNIIGGQMLGASAGILAIVVAAATASPNQEIQLALIGKVKMKYLAIAVVLIDLTSLTTGNGGGHIAHLGGAFSGYWFAQSYLRNNKDITIWITKVIDFFTTYSFKAKPKMKARTKHAATKKDDMAFNKHKKKNQVEIDIILEKIKQSGYNSLTKTEKSALFDASK